MFLEFLGLNECFRYFIDKFGILSIREEMRGEVGAYCDPLSACVCGDLIVVFFGGVESLPFAVHLFGSDLSVVLLTGA